ncbi:MAG: LacI family DNA-binding transcriptional regulator [Bifidobacterium sp.]|nr:LacI family DNA-binding transcriptional regulator [Bifidobacterium sp.]
MTTMKDVARAAGVSVATVSLVLNGREAGRVKPAMAERVREAARALDYRFNATARTLRTNASRMLGLVSLEVATTPYAGAIIGGAQAAAARLGYVLTVVNADGEADLDAEIASLDRYGIDGLLFSAMNNRVVDISDTLAAHPLVLADAVDRQERFPAIVPDEERIGYDATCRLIEAGLTRIAYLGCSTPMVAQGERFDGYRRALEEHGIAYDESLVCDVLYNDAALARVERLFDEGRPDGVFCFNDSRAWYAYQCAAERGLKVGRDVSVVGVDNHPVVSETFSPRLTTIELPHFEMGYWGVCKLVSLIRGHDVAMDDAPATTAPLPPLDEASPAKVHCTLLERGSVRP